MSAIEMNLLDVINNCSCLSDQNRAEARAELVALRAKETEYDRIAVLISTVWDSPDVYAGVQRLIEEG